MVLRRLGRYLDSSLWVVPVLCILGAVVLALATTAIDRYFGHGLIPQAITGNPNAAQSILSSVASSTVTLLSLALTLTLVVVQLAMGQFSPRIVRALLSDRRTQLAIGLFVTTFVYSMLVLRRIDSQGDVLPGLSVLVAYALMLASIVGLILYLHHSGQRLRVGGLISLVGDELRKQIDEFYPAEGAASNPQDEQIVVGIVVIVHRLCAAGRVLLSSG